MQSTTPIKKSAWRPGRLRPTFGLAPLCSGLLLAGCIALPAMAATPGPVVNVGSGSYRNGLPASSDTDTSWRGPSQVNSWGPGGVPVYGPAIPFFKGVGATSSQWWSGLGWHYWGQQASGLNSVPNYAWPMAFQTRPEGVGIWMPDSPSLSRNNGGNFAWMAGTPIDGVELLGGNYEVSKYSHLYDQDMAVGLEGMVSTDPYIVKYSDWAVTSEWTGGANKLEVTSSNGSPFMFFKRTAGTANAKVDITGGITVWSNTGNVLGITITKAAANYRPGTSHSYALFAPTGTTWTQSGTSYIANLGAKGYFSVAALPSADAATLAEYKKYAYNFITDTKFSWAYNEGQAKLTSTFNISTQNQETSATNGPTLTAIFPHAWKSNLNNPVNTAYTYQASNGKMKVVNGSSFSTEMRFNGVLPTLPVTSNIDKTRLNNWINGVVNDPNQLWQTPPEGSKADVYWNGRSMGRMIEMLDIAVQTGNTAARDKILGELKAKLQNWLGYNGAGNEAAEYYAYDPTWRTLCPAYDVHFSCRDLSDHHFINGYYIRAAAAIAMYDPAGATWVANWGPMIEQLIKDPFNWDRTDTKYPFLRQFSPMEGHTWAGGIAFGDGLNQESSSEAMNFATALVMYGSAAGNNTIRDLGIMHYVNEQRSIEEYVFDVDNENFPAEYKPSMAGMIWSNGRIHGTWWTAEPHAVLGINLLPIQPGSVYLGRRPDVIQAQLDKNDYFEQKYRALPDSSQGAKSLMGPLDWSDLWWSYKALTNADTAATDFEANLAAPPEFGNTKADTYAWIYSLKALGRLDVGVTANTPTYNVFNKNGVKSYVAYNAGTTSKCVTFSDGKSMQVAAKQIVLNGTVSCGTTDVTAPTVPGGVSVSGASNTSLTVKWTASTDAGGSGLAGYNIYRGALQVGTVGDTVLTFTESGLNPGTTYSYTVKARDGANNLSADSAVASGTTLSSSDTIAPSVPGGVSVSGATSSSLTVKWSASTDNTGGSGMAGYDVYRGTGKVGSTPAATLQFTESGLTASTAYSYTVKARDVAGNASANSAVASGTTLGNTTDVTPPSVPTLSLGAVGNGSITINWTASTDNAGGTGVGGYDIQRFGVTIASVGATVTTFTDQGLTLNTTYAYTVKAKDKATPVNVSAASNSVQATTGQGGADTTAPSVATGLAVTATTDTSASLSWSAASDNAGGSGMAGYNVYRSGGLVGTLAGTTFTDTNLIASSNYTYTVRSRDVAGNLAAASAGVVATTKPAAVVFVARNQMQAEAFSAKEPRVTVVASGTAVGTTVDGTWIKFANVDFGTASPIDFVVRVASGLAGSGSLTLYKDSILAANQIASLGVGNTGGWSTWTTIPMNLGTAVTGKHDLYIKFTTPYVDPNGLVNLDWIQFR